MANKNTKKYIYCIIAVAVACAVIAAICFASCEKKEIIGYDPPTPQEWLDEIEAEKNRPDTEVFRTYDMDGIWRDKATGQLYQVYMGHIFTLDKIDAKMGDYSLFGTMVAMQNMLKTEAEEINTNSGGNVRNPGDEYQIYFSAPTTEESEGTLIMIDADTVKTVTKSGEEFSYEFVQACDGWPEGYR